ncbi:MAG: hypothetical protein WCH34_10830 [Bacteroidota bacterium]
MKAISYSFGFKPHYVYTKLFLALARISYDLLINLLLLEFNFNNNKAKIEISDGSIADTTIG